MYARVKLVEKARASALEKLCQAVCVWFHDMPLCHDCWRGRLTPAIFTPFVIFPYVLLLFLFNPFIVHCRRLACQVAAKVIDRRQPYVISSWLGVIPDGEGLLSSPSVGQQLSTVPSSYCMFLLELWRHSADPYVKRFLNFFNVRYENLMISLISYAIIFLVVFMSCLRVVTFPHCDFHNVEDQVTPVFYILQLK